METKKTELELTILDRIKVLNEILPKQFDMISGITIKGIMDKVNFTVSEIEEFNMVTKLNPDGQGRTTWDDEKARGVAFEFSQAEMKVLRQGARTMDEKKQITLETISVCQKLLG